MWSGAYPMAVLQTGEHPIWFKLSENGPVHIESIEDAVYTSALVPWPYALHIRFLHERASGLYMIINRDGFLKIAPNDRTEYKQDMTNMEHPGIALYRFSGDEFWRQYTVGGFVFYDDEPAALLYLDNRFMDTDLPQPLSRTWSFNMNSNSPFPIQIPALEHFPAEENWSADTLRHGDNGLMYYRVARRVGSSLSVQMFRTADLTYPGDEISAEVFFNSFPRYANISHSSLPPLPEGFVYTSFGQTGDSLFASWEEQEDFSIGAAGFVMIKTGN
jgi:hypothetical protein